MTLVFYIAYVSGITEIIIHTVVKYSQSLAKLALTERVLALLNIG